MMQIILKIFCMPFGAFAAFEINWILVSPWISVII